MSKRKVKDGPQNLCWKKVAQLRKSRVPELSTKELAEQLRATGIKINAEAIERIENGTRHVVDIEVLALCDVFGVLPDFLLEE